MDNQTICEAIKKHLSDVLGKSLSLRRSASLTSGEICAISDFIDTVDHPKDVSHLEKKSAWFDVYASNSILMRCVISNGSLFIIKKAVGLKKMGRSSDTPIEFFTLADPKSIEKATDSILSIISAALQAMLKKVEPLRTAVNRIQAHKEKCESH